MVSQDLTRTIALLLLLASPAVGQVTGYADYLYWQANSSDFSFQAISPEHCGSGVRAGLGYCVQHWEPSWNYTYYSSKASDGWAGYPVIDGIEEAYLSDDSLTLQLHDVQLKRYFSVHPSCELAIFGGFRWGAIDRRAYDTISKDILTADSGIGYQEWAEGNRPEGALHRQTERYLSCSNTDSYGGRLGGSIRVQVTNQLCWFAESSFSGLISVTESELSLSRSLDDQSYHDAPATSRDTHETIAVDASTGLSWTFANVEVAAGYEWHVWSNIIQRRVLPLDQSDYRDLMLEGVFARLAFVY